MNYKKLIIGLLERIDSKKFPGVCERKRGRGMSAADQHKEKIICMLENISDEKFLNQIRIILKRHIERESRAEKGGAV